MQHRCIRLAMVKVFYFFLLCFISSVSHAGFVGINTNEPLPVDSSLPFIDLFKTSTPFKGSSLTRGKVDFDEDGWVNFMHEKARAGAYFLRNIPMDALPKGQYVVKYDGDGRLGYGGGVKVQSRSRGRDVITLKSGKGNLVTAWIFLKDTNPLNYIRNIQILMPGGVCRYNLLKQVNSRADCAGRDNFMSFETYARDLIFNPDYLTFMKDFKTIRFMNMSGVTRNGIEEWKDRPRPESATWAGRPGVRGVPIEIMIQLANQLNANAWFNIPHKASDHFVEQFAVYVKDLLNPNLKVYVEYSNETWNPIFTQAQHIDEMGLKLGLDRDKEQAGFKYYSKRSIEIFKIWGKEFKDTKQLVRVLSGFAGYPKLTQQLLTHFDAYKYTDAFAIAPYFYVKGKELLKTASPDHVFRMLNNDHYPYSINNVVKRVKKHADIAHDHGVELIAYEGGQHLVVYTTKSKTEHPNPILMEANADPRMESLYIRLFNGWRSAGGKEFMAFSSPRTHEFFGFWGLKEHINQEAELTPKYRAALRYAR